MVLRVRKIVFVGSLALVLAVVLLLAGPLSGAANASPCKRFGEDMPRHLSPRHARMAVRCLLNRKRENHGLRRLGKSGRLKEAAQRHTHYMENHRCFAHECSGEPSVLSRLKKVNYIVGGLRRWLYGENIAYGGSHLGTPPGASPQHPQSRFPPGRDRLCPRNPAGAGLERRHVHDRLRDARALAAPKGFAKRGRANL
jgi:hypothetical protein